MRRLSGTELLLLAAILLWSLSLPATRYILTNGMEPLAYSTVRYGLGAIVSAAIVLTLERSLRVRRRDLVLVGLGALVLYGNQIAFVYTLRSVSASVSALLLAITPIIAALIALALGRERLSARFWVGSVGSVAGVALVALATAGAAVSGNATGILLALTTALTWAIYSIITADLAGRYSAARISVLMLAVSWVPIAITGLSQTARQDWDLGWGVWGTFAYTTLGPLVVTNLIWFHVLNRIGPSKATLATNLQPFLAAVFGVILLGESLSALQLVGGVLILAGLAAARSRRPTPVAGE